MNQAVHCAVLLLTGLLTAFAAPGRAAAPPLSYCSAALGGGPPPQIMSAQSLAALKAILAPYEQSALTADQARAIQRALGDAGMRRSPALDQALGDAGFAAKRLEALAPCRPNAVTEPTPSASGRAVPRPQ